MSESVCEKFLKERDLLQTMSEMQQQLLQQSRIIKEQQEMLKKLTKNLDKKEIVGPSLEDINKDWNLFGTSDDEYNQNVMIYLYQKNKDNGHGAELAEKYI